MDGAPLAFYPKVATDTICGISTTIQDIEDHEAPVTTLRGASVAVDGRKVGNVVVVLCLGALWLLTIFLFAAGEHKNAQISELRRQGVAVRVTVSGCTGLLGGSGSNAAGYSCRGTYVVAGHRENQTIPGDTLYARGSTIQGVSVTVDPALLSTVSALSQEHASSRVFLLPALLALASASATAALVLRSLRNRRVQPARLVFSGLEDRFGGTARGV